MASILIDFVADISGATKEISKFSGSVDSEFKKLNSTFSGLAKVFSGLAAAIGIGFSLKSAIDEASQYEDAVNGLATALRLTGIESKTAVVGFEEFAAQIQATTRLSDDAVLSSASLLQSIARLSEDGLKQGTQAAIDLAAALRIDLDSATRLVGKAAEGNVSAFKRYGIEIRQGKNDAETFANTLKTLNDRFGGAAVSATNTYAGALDQLRNNFNDVLKQIGLGVIENKDFIRTLKDISGALIDIVPLAAKFGASIGVGISESISIVRDLIVAFQVLTNKIVDLFDTLRQLPVIGRVFTGIQKGVEGITGAIGSLLKGLRSVVGSFKDVEEAQFKVGDLRAEQLAARSELSGSRSTSGSLFAPGPRIDLEAQKKAAEARNKSLLDEQEQRDKIIKEQLKKEEDERRKLFTSVQTVVASLGQGAAGVATSLASFGSLVVDSLIPGLGGAAGQLLQFLAQGPEAVRSQIQAFIDGIPLIIDNIVASIPVVIDTLAANSGKIISSLSAQMPVVASRLAVSLIAETPNIAKSFIESLISESGRLITSIADGVKDAISKAVGLGGGGGGVLGGLGGSLLGGLVGGPVGAIGGAIKKFKFAEGGMVPGGAPFTDRVPALLTPGEVVLNREQVSALSQAKSSEAPQSSQPLTVNLMIGEEQLANVILNLQRQGFLRNGV